jgi:hypothetical protein
MLSRRIAVFSWLLSSIIGPSVALAQPTEEQFVNFFSDTWNQRIDVLYELEDGWDATLLAAMGTRSGGLSLQDEALFQISARKWVAMSNDFWTSDGVFKLDTFDKTVLRLPLVPAMAERQWHDALSRHEGGDLQRMIALGPLLNQDALFAGGEWQEAAFPKLLARVMSLPHDSVSEWAKRQELESRCIAAVSLAQIDALFPNEHFQPNLLPAQP